MTVPGRSPIIPEVGVVALVPDRFQGAWQPRHQVMTRLSRYYPVAWLEPPPSWRQVLGRGPSTGKGDGLGAPAPPGMKVLDPGARYPRFHRPALLAELTARARLKAAVQDLRRRGCRNVVLYLWRPQFLADLDRVDHDVSCYHIDDEYSFSSTDTPVSDQERTLLERVDQVFIHSPALLEKKGAVNPNTRFTPNGVDFHAFSRPVPEPADLAAVPRPRIGYVGFLKKQLDWVLLDALADRHPEWNFVFVGPRHDHPEIQVLLDLMEGRHNVHFLGAKPVTELGAYPQHFDVSILPYRIDDYTRYINPLKFYEYMAAGPPAVGVPIRSLQDFADHIFLAEGVGPWSAALDRALADDAQGDAARDARRALARQYDWNLLVRGIAEALADRLGEATRGRLDRHLQENVAWTEELRTSRAARQAGGM